MTRASAETQEIQEEESTPEYVEPKRARLEPLPKKGARSQKTGPKKRAKKHPAIPSDKIGRQIYGLHQIACILTKDPQYAIQEEQAELLGLALFDVCDKYELWWLFAQTPLVTLITTAVMVEGPIVKHAIESFAEKRKQRQEKAPKPEQTQERAVEPETPTFS